AIPGDERPVEAAEWHAIEPYVSDRDRLHGERSVGPDIVGDAEEGALEGQCAVAVAGRAFGKEDEIVAPVEPVANGVALVMRAAHPAIDEDGALQLGEPADERPARDIGLGDEGRLEQRSQNLDVEEG